ncbi:MAG: hypothetical protein VKK59_05005, partial [Vampirovibrionales bacterium]|nr:hypothetical protein [Vampirovibrionales bacterium]
LTTPAATTKSNAMPDDAVIQQAIHNYREAHYEQTLLLLSTLPKALQSNPYVNYYRALSYDRKENINQAKAFYEKTITLAAPNTQVRDYAEKRLKTLNSVLDVPPKEVPSKVAIQKARTDVLASHPEESQTEQPKAKNLEKHRPEKQTDKAVSTKDSPEERMAESTAKGDFKTSTASPPALNSPSGVLASAQPPMNQQQLLQTMMLMQAMGGNGSGNSAQGGGMNPLLLMSLMGGTMPGSVANPQENYDPNVSQQSTPGINPALMQSMLMDQMMQQMDFSSPRSDQDR